MKNINFVQSKIQNLYAQSESLRFYSINCQKYIAHFN